MHVSANIYEESIRLSVILSLLPKDSWYLEYLFSNNPLRLPTRASRSSYIRINLNVIELKNFKEECQQKVAKNPRYLI